LAFKRSHNIINKIRGLIELRTVSINVVLDGLFQRLRTHVSHRKSCSDLRFTPGERQSSHVECFLDGGEDDPLVILVVSDIGVLTQNIHGVQTISSEHIVESADQFLLAVALYWRFLIK